MENVKKDYKFIEGFKYIEIRDGVPYIKNTQTKVRELVVEHYAYGWSPEEMVRQHPFLKLSEVYNAFAFLYEGNNYDNLMYENIYGFLESSRLSEKIKPIFTKEILLQRLNNDAD